MMEAVHATEEWQRAGVHYIRIQAMCVGFDIPLKLIREQSASGQRKKQLTIF